MMSSIKPAFAYRPDIDGLRAVAVLAVLLFHAGIPGFPGGFVGVDVFFVISGYLITEMMWAEFRRNNTISLVGFWARRFKRLAPALVFFLLITLLASIFLLERISGETGALMRAALATVAINANHFFLLTSGDYFGAAAETNPLLHMWSLAVEEQFYLLWPILLLLCLSRLRAALRLPVLLLITVLSFVLACIWTSTQADWAFYLMPARAWEMLAGALLALAWRQRELLHDRGGVSPVIPLSLCGLLLIAASVLFQHENFGFPGPMALFPVAGAVLVILGGMNGTRDPGARLLSAPLMVYIGKISYPLYLWHWTVLVIMRSRRLYETSIVLDVLALLISFILAVFTYECVEKKVWRHIRLESIAQKWRMIGVGVAASLGVAALALVIGAWARYGWGYSEVEKRIANSRLDKPSGQCMFGDGIPSIDAEKSCFIKNSKGGILLLGDSHANHWKDGLIKSGKMVDSDVSEMTMNSCKPIASSSVIPGCDAFNQYVIHKLPQWKADYNLKVLVLSASWPEGSGVKSPRISDALKWPEGTYYYQKSTSIEQSANELYFGLSSTIQAARELNLNVILITPTPVQRYAPSQCLTRLLNNKCFVSEQMMFRYTESSLKVLQKIAMNYSNVRLYEPMKTMCWDGKCPVEIDGLIGFTDEYHLSSSYTKTQSQYLVPLIEWALQSTQSEK